MHKLAPPNRLKELRIAHGLRQVDVATLVSRDQSVVAGYETGRVKIPDEAKRILAFRYGVSIEHLMGWDADGEAA